MAVPATNEIAEIYKSPTIVDEKRVAIELDYNYFNGAFAEEFSGAALDTTKWYSFCPSWGHITVGGGSLRLSVTGNAISPPWVQVKPNLAFPVRRDTDWYMVTRARFPVVTGFGSWMCVVGHSYRDVQAIWALKADGAGGTPGDTNRVRVHMPYAGIASPLNSVIWSTAGAPASYRQYRLDYDASAQTYTARIDQNDDVVDPTDASDPGWETKVTIPVAGRYADTIVIGNSVAIQGWLGTWTEPEVNYVRVYGTAEPIVDPQWAAPFTYDGTRWSYLPNVIGGRVSTDIDNTVDAAEVTLANMGLNEDMTADWQQYTDFRFWNRRAFIEMRAGDGCGHWAPWEVRGDMVCAEKQVRLETGGRCTLTLPMRDRYRALADDMLVSGCYSDAGATIPGVGMNMTVAEIIEDLYGDKCGLAAAAYNVAATPHNTPRDYNVFRQSCQQAVKTLCGQAALAVWALRTNAQIQVQEWPWTCAPTYRMSSAAELLSVEWTESAFDVTSGEQLSFSNTNSGGVMFELQWPPQREPFYGRVDEDDAVVAQVSADTDNRELGALMWWAKNRKIGSVSVTALAQYWADIGDQIEIVDGRFLGIRGDYILDGIDISWNGNETGLCTFRFIDPHFDTFLRKGLRG